MRILSVTQALEAKAPMYLVGCDPGEHETALVVIRAEFNNGYRATLKYANYFPNKKLYYVIADVMNVWADPDDTPMFTCVEVCGTQFGKRGVGASVFETAAMGGCVRYGLGPRTDGLYCMRSGEWRYALTGHANATTSAAYNEMTKFFEPTGKGHDPYKGVAAYPGPLWRMFEVSVGKSSEHCKDALGITLGLMQHNFRTGETAERFRKEW